MIDRALNENCNYDTEQSEFDPSQDDTHEILKDLDGSSSHRNTTENNNRVLEETKALMAQLKLSLNDKEANDPQG